MYCPLPCYTVTATLPQAHSCEGGSVYTIQPHQNQFTPVAAVLVPMQVWVPPGAGSLGEGLNATRHRVTLQAPGCIQHSPSAAWGCCELSNTSCSHIPTALSEKSDYPAEHYLTHPKKNLFTFLFVCFNLISCNFSTLVCKNTALQRHITNTNCL